MSKKSSHETRSQHQSASASTEQSLATENLPEPKRPVTPPPLLEGPPEIEEGYYDLEEHERNQSWEALNKQSDSIALWYRGLTLYRRELLTGWNIASYQHKSLERSVRVLQLELLALGISAAKSSLDDLIAGYYSQAFAGIRHLIELSVQCIYLEFNYDKYTLWYEDEDNPFTQKDPPGMQDMCQAIDAEPSSRLTGVPKFMDRAYNSWNMMSKGVHPSGVGIRQTSGKDPATCLFGPTYDQDLYLPGCDIGLFALCRLLPLAIRMAKHDYQTHMADWDHLDDAVEVWRSAHADALLAAQGPQRSARTSNALPRPVPQVSADDVKRCYKLIHLRHEEMNRWRS